MSAAHKDFFSSQHATYHNIHPLRTMDRQDHLERGGGFFETPTSFDKAFPSISALEIKVEIRRDGPMQERADERFFSLGHPPGEYVRCPRASCVNGGWCIGTVLRDMVHKGETQLQTGGLCAGRERMNRKTTRGCLTLFQAEIKIAYRANVAEP